MTLFFLVALGSAWLAVLLPAAMRARRSTPLSSAQRFKRGMQLIAPPPARASGGRWIVSPNAGTRFGASRRRILERRKRMFEALSGVALGTFALALIQGEGVWVLHLWADAALFAYAVVLLGVKRRHHDASAKIRPLPRQRQVSSERFSFNEPAQAGGGGN